MKQMRIAVIGGGAAGLVSARHIIDSSCYLDVYEQSNRVGGTWNYSEDTTEHHHSSMYKNLRTNLPIELMTFEGFDYDDKRLSFCYSPLILDYLNKYSDRFELRKHIKFNTMVTNVSRENNRWRVTSKNVITNDMNELYYDSVIVCNGHYTDPSMPYIEGSNKFKGKMIHSHSYRIPDIFAGENVLTIGMGPSGQDITFDIAVKANKVYMSHHFPEVLKNNFPKNAEHKPDVDHLTEDLVVFKDGTSAEIDSILFCTGYNYTFPFLDDSCGISVDENYVKPLYKHFISIPHPSMAFIGIPFRILIFPMLEIQVKSFLSLLLKKAEIPTRQEMEAETRKMEEKLEKMGVPKKRYHQLKEVVPEYLNSVAKIGNVEPLPEVFLMIFERCFQARRKDLSAYRNENYRILDSRNFTVEHIE